MSYIKFCDIKINNLIDPINILINESTEIPLDILITEKDDMSASITEISIINDTSIEISSEIGQAGDFSIYIDDINILRDIVLSGSSLNYFYNYNFSEFQFDDTVNYSFDISLMDVLFVDEFIQSVYVLSFDNELENNILNFDNIDSISMDSQNAATSLVDFLSYTVNGDNIKSDIIGISNENELQLVIYGLDKHYKLLKDIDASGTRDWNGGLGFDPLGNVGTMFTGYLDGQFYAISNLYINRQTQDYVGLFGICDSQNQALVENLFLLNVDVTGDQQTGSFCGRWGTFRRCYSTGSVASGATNPQAGGFIGMEGVQEFCGTAVNITGKSYTGGFVGDRGVQTNCFSVGSVDGGSSGLIGGFAARAGTISKCFSSAAVITTSSSSVGGLCGVSDVASDVSDSFWDIESSGQEYSAGGIGKTTAEMKNINTFLEAGWDFVGEDENGTDYIWDIKTGEYPTLEYLMVEDDEENENGETSDIIRYMALDDLNIKSIGGSGISTYGSYLINPNFQKKKYAGLLTFSLIQEIIEDIDISSDDVEYIQNSNVYFGGRKLSSTLYYIKQIDDYIHCLDVILYDSGISLPEINRGYYVFDGHLLLAQSYSDIDGSIPVGLRVSDTNITQRFPAKGYRMGKGLYKQIIFNESNYSFDDIEEFKKIYIGGLQLLVGIIEKKSYLIISSIYPEITILE